MHFADPPRIVFFQITTWENNSMTLTCLADGSPQPTYAIHGLDGTELPGVLNGVVIIGNYSSASTIVATFTCIAKNDLGTDERCLHIHRCSLEGKNIYSMELMHK